MVRGPTRGPTRRKAAVFPLYRRHIGPSCEAAEVQSFGKATQSLFSSVQLQSRRRRIQVKENWGKRFSSVQLQRGKWDLGGGCCVSREGKMGCRDRLLHVPSHKGQQSFPSEAVEKTTASACPPERSEEKHRLGSVFLSCVIHVGVRWLQ